MSSTRSRVGSGPGSVGPLAVLCAVLALLAAGCNGVSAGPPVQAPARPSFDGERAYALLVKQCDFGPRPVGSEAHGKARDYLVAEMRRYADKVVTQDFTYRSMHLTNVIGIFNPDASRSVMLSAHWDTRPTADMEIDAMRQRRPIVGANDGASGVAVLLELARTFKEHKPRVGVLLVLLDGEDYGDFQKDEGVFLGSRHFAAHHDAYRPAFGVLLDMIGQKDVRIPREGNSEQLARWVNDKVFSTAKRLGYSKHFDDHVPPNYWITDDHIALNRGGIPTIDLIDFDYAPWHTLADTPDKCSADALAAVGSTLAEVVYGEPART